LPSTGAELDRGLYSQENLLMKPQPTLRTRRGKKKGFLTVAFISKANQMQLNGD